MPELNPQLCLAKALNSTYVFPEKAKQLEEVLRKDLKDDLAAETDGAKIAAFVQKRFNEIANDHHLRLFYLDDAALQRHADAMKQASTAEPEKFRNGGYRAVQILPGNIGYIDVTGFPQVENARGPAGSAFDFVKDTDALILDLRDNMGGDATSVQELCSHLFSEEPVHLNDIYFREGDHTEEFWTLKTVPGSRFLDKDVLILTSPETASGGEECAYDLQVLKRGKTVGEKTWGGANPGQPVEVSKHFVAFIPFGKAINPYTKKNWEGTGVTPDVACPAPEALKKAQIMLLTSLRGKAATAADRARLESALKEVQG